MRACPTGTNKEFQLSPFRSFSRSQTKKRLKKQKTQKKFPLLHRWSVFETRRVWRAEGCKLAPSVKNKKAQWCEAPPKGIVWQNCLRHKKKAGANGVYGEATHVCKKHRCLNKAKKKRVSDNGRTKIVVRASQFSKVPTLLHSGLKRGTSIVCLLFCEKNLFYFYNHNRNSRLLAILRNVLCNLSVLVKLLLLFFEIILLYVRQFLYKSEKKTPKSRRPLKKKGSHVFIPKICEQSEKKPLHVCTCKKKKVLP